MSNELVESYLLRTGVPHEQVDPSTYVIQLDNERRSRIAIKVEAPIVLFTTPVLDITKDTNERENLFRTLLEFNAQLLHSSYALEAGRVVLSGAQPLENLDLNEFQAVLDDMTMALDTHSDTLGKWNIGVAHA
jgi:hypothetical protein